MSQIGSFALLLALGLSAYSFLSRLCRIIRKAMPPRLALAKPPAAPESPLSRAVLLAGIVLVVAAFNDDFSIAYIFHHSNRDLARRL